ncbi:MAG: hypothetical protein J7L47_01870 [Candidatus Odinarchaeota archaeon]|nr:hypothetical protein [Candidatus Odinarchaeota archaeon]
MIEKIVSILNQGEHEMMRNIDSFNNMMPSQGIFGVPFMFIGGFLLFLVINN